MVSGELDRGALGKLSTQANWKSMKVLEENVRQTQNNYWEGEKGAEE